MIKVNFAYVAILESFIQIDSDVKVSKALRLIHFALSVEVKRKIARDGKVKSNFI